MTLIKTNSGFSPVTFGSIIDKFFNDSLSRTGGSSFLPVVDIAENDAAFEIHITAPGLRKEDFQIEVRDKQLTVSGERKLDREEKGKTWHSIQSTFGRFSRSFYLPENVADGKIKASYENGILLVQIPKDETKALLTTIKVN